MSGSRERFILDTSKIGTDEEAMQFRNAVIERVLSALQERKPFGVGDIVATLHGPYAHQGMMVVEIKDNGETRVAPAPNTPTVELKADDLYHFDDYHEAFKVALIEEQSRPQRKDLN